jgi:subtilase family serine protease
VYCRGLRRVAFVGALAAACLAAAGGTALAAQPEVRIGTAPTLPQGTTLVAGLASVQSMQITLALAPRQPAALDSYAQAVGDPTSPDYRRYLTPSEFRQRFAPTSGTLARVEDSLRRHGLTPGAVSANGLSIHVLTSGAVAERAFDLTLARVRLPGGRDAVYNTQAPAVDANIAPAVQAVIGLSSLARMQRLDVTRTAVAPRTGLGDPARGARTSSAHIVTGGPQPCAKAAEIAPGQGAYTADQIATAYGFSGLYQSGDLGQGVTIGLYELEPNAPGDISAYQKCYGTNVNVSYVKVDGGAGTGPGEGEAALDIEQVIGLVPKARVIVYQGPNNNSDSPGTGPYDTLEKMVSQDKAQVLSNSWGECETLEGPTDANAESTLLQEAATQGQTFVSAAGDSGSEDCYSPPPGGNIDNALAVDDPGSQEFATSVGGTSMSTIGPPPTETVWNDDNPDIDYARFGIQQGAGGGGVSMLWKMPSYQASAASTLGVINANSSGAPCAAAAGSYCREVPDVAADADPMTSYLDYWNGADTNTRSESGWQGTGGTSGAAPVWAAVFALADANRDCRGTMIGFANASLYALASQSQTTYFNDVTTGNNDFTPTGNTSGLYPAGVGYDMASGLGTPKAAALVPALCQQAVHVTYPGAVYTFYTQHVRMHLRAALAPGQTGPITYHSSRLPIGLHLDRATGVISGVVTRVGVRDVTVTASTASGTYGAVQFNWSVERRPHVAAAVAGAAARPDLTMVVRSGQYEPGMRELTITLPRRLTLASPARDVKVQTTSGGRLPHQAHFSDHILTIRLDAAHSPVQIVFAPGSLRASGGMVGVVSVSVQAVDRVGGRTTLLRTARGHLTPRL